MDSSEKHRLFLRHLLKDQRSLQVDLCCISSKAKKRRRVSKELLDISSGGLSFKSNLADEVFLPGMFLEKIELFSPEGCLLQTPGEVKHTTYKQLNSSRPYYKVGVEFDVGFADDERQYKARLKKQREKIVNPVLIFGNLKNMLENKIPVSLEDVEYPTRSAIVGHFTQLVNSTKFYTIIFKPVNQASSSHLFEEFDRVQAMYQFNADGYRFASVIIAKTHQNIVLKIPKSISRLWQRGTLRYLPPQDDLMSLKIEHPMFKGVQLKRRVIDLTPNGLSVYVEYPDDLFIKDMFIPKTTLIIPGERPINVSVQVKYISMVMDEQMKNYFKCGLSFVGLPVNETNFLVSYLLGKCYPHLKDAQGEGLETIWKLFDESGFIYQEKRKFLAPIVTEANDTFKKLLEPDNRFYKNIILKDAGKCSGTVSIIWAYEHTWILQQLATAHDFRKCVSKDMVKVMVDFCTKCPDVDYLKIFWRPNNPWADKIFGRFARMVSDRPDISHLVRYAYLFKSQLEDSRPIEPPKGIVIEPITESDNPLIESYFVARGEIVILKADSLLREEIGLPHTRLMFKQKGLMRERRIYLAKSGQKLLGFVIIEDASLGINLSGLLNYFKVYTTAECGEIEAQVKSSLICQAVEYYKQQGRNFAICLADDDLEAYQALGFEKKKEYMCWTGSQELVQPYFNFVNEYFTRIEKRIALKTLAR